jgi:hypothetical protein
MPSRLVKISWYRHHMLNLVVLAAVCVIVAGTVDNTLSGRDLARESHATAIQAQELARNLRLAICTLRHDRQRAVRSTRDFLKQHPDGIPGIPRADFLRNLHLQQETIQAFRFAHCKPLNDDS